jgi:hypothetical protein
MNAIVEIRIRAAKEKWTLSVQLIVVWAEKRVET